MSRPLEADNAVRIALLNNRNMQALYESLGIAEADLVEAGLLSNPVFDAEIRFFRGTADPSAEVNLLQNVVNIFFLPLKKRVAESGLESAKFQVAQAVIELAGKVRAAFFDLLAAHESLELRQHIVRAADASYMVVQRRRAAGNVSALNLVSERAFLEQARLEQRSSEFEVVKRREQLNGLMGLWGTQTRWTTQQRLPVLPREEVHIEGLEGLAVRHSFALAVTRQEFEQLATTLGIARPQQILDAAELGLSGEHDSGSDWGLGPGFILPIPIFNYGKPALVRANARLRMIGERYFAQAVELRAAARTAHASVIAAHDRARYYRAVVLPLWQEIVDQTQLQYNAMQLSPVQLLQAKQEQIETAEASIRAIRDYWVEKTKLNLVLAGGSMASDQDLVPLEFASASLNLRPSRG